MLLGDEGRLHEARAAREVALELARRHDPQAVIWILGLEAEIALYAGERANLESVAEARELAEKLGGSYWRAIADSYLGLAHKTVGDLHAARSHLECALASLRARPHPHQPRAMGYLAEVFLQLGNSERAGALAEEAVEVAQARGATGAEQSSLLSLSRVLLRSEGAEAWDTVATAIERGLALADQTGLVVLVPQFLVERAELARLRGDESERLHHLRDAHRLFVEMGATGHAERLARELGL
jgi:tetratricopeptide (TPR) repeat protein